MTRLKAGYIAALTALALVLSQTGTAYGIPIQTNGWQLAGTTLDNGGYVIVGTGTTDVGPLGPNTIPTRTSILGFDFVTLNLGATASNPFGFNGATILFTTSNDFLLNYGTINAASQDAASVFANTGVGFSNFGVVSNDAVINNGVINAGSGNSSTRIVDSGIGFWGGNGIYNATVTNTGIINGGGFTSTGFGEAAAIGAGVVLFDNNNNFADINLVHITNSNLIKGGSTVDGAIITGDGVAVVGLGNVSNVTFTNTGTGSVKGGSNNTDGFFTGAGVVFAAGANPFNTNANYNLSNVVFSNAGQITGGDNNVNSDNFFSNQGNVAGAGVAFWGNNGVFNLNVSNTGSVTGGSNNDGSNESSAFGSLVGTGIGIFDANASLQVPQDISGVNLTNSGNISGGNNNSNGIDLGSGVAIVGFGNVAGIGFTNTATGVIKGGDGGIGGFGGFFFGSTFAGAGVGFSAGQGIGDFILNGITFQNAGIISGGNNNSEALMAGVGVGFAGSNGVYNLNFTNTGVISGGNGNFNGAFVNTGVAIIDANARLGAINGVYLFNSGLITGGGGNITEALDRGSGIVIAGLGGVSNVAITNAFTGRISGGPGSTSGPLPGNEGIAILVEGNSSNLSVTNFGAITGGDAAPGGQAGAGIFSSASGLTIDNWGTISSGNGANPQSVVISGNNNTLILEGHSSVQGMVVATGNNNVLKIALTGVSPAEQSALAAVLGPYLNGVPSTGSFTFRGVTYTWDPLIIQLAPTSYQVQGITPNQKAIGANLDSFTFNPTGDMLKVLNAIDQSGNVPVALEALSPQPYQIYGDIATSAMTFTTLEIDHRLNNLRDGSENIDTTGIGGNTDKTTSGYCKDTKDCKCVLTPEKHEKRWGFFASGSGLFANIDGHGGDLSDAGFTSAGVLLGVDGKINDQLVAGLLFNYNHTDADLDNAGSNAKVESFGGGAYAGYHNGGWYGNGLFDYQHNDYNSSRNILFPGVARVATGNTTGNQYGVNIDGGYDYHVNENLTVGPLAGLQYVHLDVDGFNEFGAGAADLSVGSQRMDSLRSRLGFRVDWHKQIASEVAFATEVRAAWQHEFLDDSRAIGGTFIGSGLAPFAVRTTSPERDAALLGVGVNATIKNRMTVFFDYDVQAGQSSYLEQSVKGGLKFSF